MHCTTQDRNMFHVQHSTCNTNTRTREDHSCIDDEIRSHIARLANGLVTIRGRTSERRDRGSNKRSRPNCKANTITRSASISAPKTTSLPTPAWRGGWPAGAAGVWACWASHALDGCEYSAPEPAESLRHRGRSPYARDNRTVGRGRGQRGEEGLGRAEGSDSEKEASADGGRREA
eukprot:scaffold114276_cov31-Tisochrysis_lutea.AAC.1